MWKSERGRVGGEGTSLVIKTQPRKNTHRFYSQSIGQMGNVVFVLGDYVPRSKPEYLLCARHSVSNLHIHYCIWSSLRYLEIAPTIPSSVAEEGNRDAEQLGKLPKVTQLVSSRAYQLCESKFFWLQSTIMSGNYGNHLSKQWWEQKSRWLVMLGICTPTGLAPHWACVCQQCHWHFSPVLVVSLLGTSPSLWSPFPPPPFSP